MRTGALDPLIHDPERLRIVATLAALADGDTLTVTRLGEHFAQGRLTLDELDARLDAALTATTHGELSQAAWDLPDLTVQPARVSPG